MRENKTISLNATKTPRNSIEVECAALSVLEYFGLFSHPLLADEVRIFCPLACSTQDIYAALEEMLLTGKIFTFKSYFSTKQDIQLHVTKREKGNTLAASKIVTAKKVARFINCFPFVRFVGISGSLSKGYAEEKSDFDFFVITATNKLWICRTILHLFKKATFLFGQQHKFCMNYFIDESALKIEEKNRFTATELITLIPVSGLQLHEDLIKLNDWLYSYFPNKISEFNKDTQAPKKKPLKTAMEYTLDVLLPNSLNATLMNLTDARWKKKWAKKNYPDCDYALAFKTTLHVSKNHPLNYQKKVLSHLQKTQSADNK